MKRVGFVGWRGMVGSVLMQRMIEEGDFKQSFEPLFFTTSQHGQKGPNVGRETPALEDAQDLAKLKQLDIIVTCQGGDYTSAVYPKLRQDGWNGFWIDAASTLRMKDDSIIILDPVNRNVIDAGLKNGIKTYVGGNCTVSLMMMALTGLFQRDLIESIISMTYQAASGAGAKNMIELVKQMTHLSNATSDLACNPAASALEYDSAVTAELRGTTMPIDNFGAPLAGSLIPWIDRLVENGQTREEWKGVSETNKILGRSANPIPVDGLCVRVGAMRCHSQGLAIKLKKNLPLDEIESMLAGAHEWVKVIPNIKEDTLRGLTPAAVSGTLTVPIGRIHKMNLGPEYITAFTVGDQLLWGAAEPVRRMLNITLEV